jgi:hypothetical protein
LKKTRKTLGTTSRQRNYYHSSSLKVSSLPSLFSGLFECFFFSADSVSCFGFGKDWTLEVVESNGMIKFQGVLEEDEEDTWNDKPSLKVSSLPSLFSGLFECFFFSADSVSCFGFWPEVATG